jgi:hypothetical protein
MSDPSQSDPEPVTFHVRCEVTLLAKSHAEAQLMAAIAIEHWDDEKGWSHLDGIGNPEGFVLVTEQ